MGSFYLLEDEGTQEFVVLVHAVQQIRLYNAVKTAKTYHYINHKDGDIA